jgi:2'-5' RNA ligase
MSMQLQLFDDTSTLHNVFFALQPTMAAGERVTVLAQERVGHRRLGVRLLPLERLHVSLLAVGGFAGPLPSLIIDEAKTAAGTVSMAPFEVVFDRVASFGGGALVLMGGEGVTGVVRLQQALSLALSQAGVGARPRKPFTPHVTIAYADRMSEFSIEPISWTVSEFVLVDSLVGQSKHIPLSRFPL